MDAFVMRMKGRQRFINHGPYEALLVIATLVTGFGIWLAKKGMSRPSSASLLTVNDQ
jgi:hypothetical protein